MKRILVVEDEINVRKLQQLHLEREGYTVIGCDSGQMALELFGQNTFDLVILDWTIKGTMSGLDVCKKLTGQVPILMVTARSSVPEVVLGLEMGADDFLAKPFEIPVFMARVRALLRRSETKKVDVAVDEFTLGNLRIRIPQVEVTCQGQEVKLTASEFKLLVALAKRKGSAFSRAQLLREIQEDDIVVTDRIIDTHIYSLRTKLGACSDVIETLRGIGYRIKS